MTTVAAVTAAASSAAFARDSLESIVKKSTLTARDDAEIQTEISQRIDKLFDAIETKNDKRLQSARAKLIETSQTPGASPDGLRIYAEKCADALANAVAGNVWKPAFESALILVSLNHAAVADALAGALGRSPHKDIRYTAARGIEKLHKDLAGDPRKCADVLRALGEAGAAENNEVALRMIYKAIDFRADVPNFTLNDECAEALSTVFSSRIAELNRGSHDEWKDREGVAAAEACYAGARPNRQKVLIGRIFDLLANLVRRYGENQTADAYFSTIAQLVKAYEGSIHAMIRASGATVPSNKLTDTIKSRRPNDRAKRRAAAALAELKQLLAAPPWNIK